MRQIARLLRTHFGATQIIVFGSLVKDKFNETSDIDIAVAGIAPARYFEAVGAVNRWSSRWVDLKPLEALESRFAITGQGAIHGQGLGISAVVAISLFFLGSTVFRWVERSFADFISRELDGVRSMMKSLKGL